MCDLPCSSYVLCLCIRITNVSQFISTISSFIQLYQDQLIAFAVPLTHSYYCNATCARHHDPHRHRHRHDHHLIIIVITNTRCVPRCHMCALWLIAMLWHGFSVTHYKAKAKQQTLQDIFSNPWPTNLPKKKQQALQDTFLRVRHWQASYPSVSPCLVEAEFSLDI